MKPKFSVVMIMKNEGKVLHRGIESLKEFMALGGDVNIMDTGSTDNSVEIAKSLGCKVLEVGTKYVHTITKEEAKAINDRFVVEGERPVVYEGEKYFDFASARNFATMTMAENDWVMSMDCDEMVTKMDIERINEIISDPELAHCEYNFVFSHTPDGRELIKFVQSKFFNRTKMEWSGIIHEILAPTKGGRIFFLGEEVYKLEHWQNPDSNRTGYLRGLAVDCFEHQEKDRNSHYFARELWWNGRPWSAAKEFIRHIKMDCWPAERAESMLFLADICGAMGGHKKESK